MEDKKLLVLVAKSHLSNRIKSGLIARGDEVILCKQTAEEVHAKIIELKPDIAVITENLVGLRSEPINVIGFNIGWDDATPEEFAKKVHWVYTHS
ncbi:MAG TPA: hypothetical protein DCG49_12325 [Ruminococcus sp.]|nr:hypothetical protein [Ruminococcus sp.]